MTAPPQKAHTRQRRNTVNKLFRTAVSVAAAVAMLLGPAEPRGRTAGTPAATLTASAAADPSAGAATALKGVSFKNITYNSAVLTWTKTTTPEMKNYNIYKGTGGTAIAKVQATDKNTYTLTDLKPGTTYTYSVKGWNGSKIYTTLRSVTFTTPLAPLNNLHVASSTTTSVTLAWNAEEGMTGYNLYNGTGGSKIQSVAGTQNTMTIKENTSYTFSVRGWVGNSRGTDLKTITVKTKAVPYDNSCVIMDQLSGEFPAKKGCGGTCVAMLLRSEAGLNVSKKGVLTTQYSNGLFLYTTNGDNYTIAQSLAASNSAATLSNLYGSTLTQLQALVGCYGLSASIDRQPTITSINKLLSQGHLLVVGQRMKSLSTVMGKRVTSTTDYDGVDHFVICRGRNDQGNYIIVNPYGGYETLWTAQQLIDNIYNTETAWAMQGVIWLS